jgi:hypothetical protein
LLNLVVLLNQWISLQPEDEGLNSCGGTTELEINQKSAQSKSQGEPAAEKSGYWTTSQAPGKAVVVARCTAL